MRIVRAVLSCSLVLIACAALCGPYGDLAAKLRGLTSPQAKVDAVDASGIQDQELAKYRGEAENLNPDSVRALSDFIALKAMAEGPTGASDAVNGVKRLKSSPLYADEGEKTHANWLSGAMERVRKLFERQQEDRSDSGANYDLPSAFPSFLIYAVWIILGGAILAFIIYALRFVSFGRLRKRKARAMMEDDEPERTLDEWLALSDGFEREGKYREAVRALYLACLLKFDERNIARFMRGQTNWEHLARIESSPRRPQNLDFRTPTQAFDRIWYGHKVRGPEDVNDFRAWYQRIGEQLDQEKAA